MPAAGSRLLRGQCCQRTAPPTEGSLVYHMERASQWMVNSSSIFSERTPTWKSSFLSDVQDTLADRQGLDQDNQRTYGDSDRESSNREGDHDENARRSRIAKGKCAQLLGLYFAKVCLYTL